MQTRYKANRSDQRTIVSLPYQPFPSKHPFQSYRPSSTLSLLQNISFPQQWVPILASACYSASSLSAILSTALQVPTLQKSTAVTMGIIARTNLPAPQSMTISTMNWTKQRSPHFRCDLLPTVCHSPRYCPKNQEDTGPMTRSRSLRRLQQRLRGLVNVPQAESPS